MKTRLLVLGIAIWAALPLPASAAATLDIEVFGASFTPAVVHAVAGDQLRWTVTGGSHTITAYSGGVFAFSLVEEGSVSTYNFRGGTALYRCEFHSTLDPLTLVCDGMCASVTDRVTAPGTPRIDRPLDGTSSPFATMRFEGRAEPQTTLVLSEGTVERGRGVANDAGIWRMDVFFPNGSHTVTAHAVDVDGRVSPATAALSFQVTADTTPPTAFITSPDPSIFVRRAVVITGTAVDETALDRIEVEISRLIAPPVVVAASCFGCGGKFATWKLEDAIGPGVAFVRARAIDVGGNPSEWTEPITVINGRLRP